MEFKIVSWTNDKWRKLPVKKKNVNLQIAEALIADAKRLGYTMVLCYNRKEKENA